MFFDSHFSGMDLIIYLYKRINYNSKSMIQRIQTVYLFLAAVIMFSMVFFPFVEIIDAGDRYYRFDLHGIHEGMGETARLIQSVLPLRFLVLVTAILSLGIIFLYKRRILQIRLCVFNMVLMAGFYALFFFYLYHLNQEVDTETINYKIPLVFPAISIILAYLAIRNITRDELLVRSYDRIR